MGGGPRSGPPAKGRVVEVSRERSGENRTHDVATAAAAVTCRHVLHNQLLSLVLRFSFLLCFLACSCGLQVCVLKPSMHSGRCSFWTKLTPSKTIVKRPFSAQILAGSLLEPDFGNLRASRPQLKAPSKTIGKRPFSAKSWPGAFWGQILAICRLLEASGKLLGSFW